MQGAGRFGLALLLAVLALSGLLTRAAAQDPNLPYTVPSPILTLDQEKLFASSLWGKRVAAEVERVSTDLATENRKIEADLTAEEKQLTDQRPQLDPAEFRSLADAFDTKVVEIRRAQDTKARDLARLRDEESAAFFTAVLPILGTLMTETGAVAVLDTRAIFLSSGSVDVTESLLARVDLELGAGPAIVPEEGAPAPEMPAGMPTGMPAGTPPETAPEE